MKKIFSIIALAIMMLIGSTNNAMAQHHHHDSDVIERLAVALVQATGQGTCGSYNPHTGMTRFVGQNCTCESNCSLCRVTSVEKCADHTTVHFVYQPTEDTHVDIVANTVIKDYKGGLTFPLRATTNIYTDHSVNVSAGQPYEFSLIFPSLTIQCQDFDVVAHYPDHDLVFKVHGLPATYCN